MFRYVSFLFGNPFHVLLLKLMTYLIYRIS